MRGVFRTLGLSGEGWEPLGGSRGYSVHGLVSSMGPTSVYVVI